MKAMNVTGAFRFSLHVGGGFQYGMGFLRHHCMNVLAGANVGQIPEKIWTWITAWKGWGCHCSNRMC
jgi:hypothetical protein